MSTDDSYSKAVRADEVHCTLEVILAPSVTVVIPFHAGSHWLSEAVESVLAQTHPASEVIVVNDGSVESLADFLREYGDKITYITQPHEGPGSARNAGIERSKGDYIAFLDSDDVWLPTKLERQVSVMLHANSDWSHTSYETFDSDLPSRAPNRVSIADFEGRIYPRMLMSSRLATPCIMVKGDLLRGNSHLRFHESMRYGEDNYLWMNLAISHPIVAIDEVLTRVRRRRTSAAVRARVQLAARASAWDVLRSDRTRYRVAEIPASSRAAFAFSGLGARMLRHLETRVDDPAVLEAASRLFYAVPWVLFRFSFMKSRYRRSADVGGSGRV